MLKLAGLVLVFNGALAAGYLYFELKKPIKESLFLFGAMALTGVILLLNERITEVTIPGLGSIKAAAQQAVADATEIAEVRKRIESQSATVDLVAKQASETKALSEQLAQTLEAANKKLAELEEVTSFAVMVAAAQSDDRVAFDRLLVFANTKDHPLAAKAKQAWAAVLDEHNPAMIRSGFPVNWKPGIDPAKLTLKQIAEGYGSTQPFERPGLIEYVWGRTDFPKRDRMAFLIEVVKKDPSLTAVEYAGRTFCGAAGLNLKPLAVEQMLAWWKENHDKVKD